MADQKAQIERLAVEGKDPYDNVLRLIKEMEEKADLDRKSAEER